MGSTHKMSKRVISDPESLGWFYDDEVGRWRWSGTSGGGSDGCGDLESRVAALEQQIDAGEYTTRVTG